MADVLNVASDILSLTGEVSTMKLQKLVFYSQAYHLVRQGSLLFDDDIEAWKNGPVVHRLFNSHKGKYVVGARDLPRSANPAFLDDSEKASINHVVSVLGAYTGSELSKLTHSEQPWRNARTGLSAEESSSAVITPDAILAYYGSGDCPNPVFA